MKTIERKNSKALFQNLWVVKREQAAQNGLSDMLSFAIAAEKLSEEFIESEPALCCRYAAQDEMLREGDKNH